MDKRLEKTGYIAFFLSGICAISSGIIVSVLQQKYGFSYGMTGTLLSFMSIGNMVASFLSGILPTRIGTKKTVGILCSGYFLGYILMAFMGFNGALIAGFLMVGLAKGCAINNCTVLVGNNSKDRTIGMNLMHAAYALGAMVCPFLISALIMGDGTFAILGVAVIGLLMWLVFFCAKLPGKNIHEGKSREKADFSFMKNTKFWLLTALVFCQNAAETGVTGWLVTYYKNQGILSGTLSAYTVTIMWGATLLCRLLIAFVFPIRNTFKALMTMGISCSAFYVLLIGSHQPVAAVLMLFCFAFSMAGVNPVAVAGVGKMMNATSMGVLLPIASIGAILAPWMIGVVAQYLGLQAGMMVNLIPCIGIFVLSFILLGQTKNSADVSQRSTRVI